MFSHPMSYSVQGCTTYSKFIIFAISVSTISILQNIGLAVIIICDYISSNFEFILLNLINPTDSQLTWCPHLLDIILSTFFFKINSRICYCPNVINDPVSWKKQGDNSNVLWCWLFIFCYFHSKCSDSAQVSTGNSGLETFKLNLIFLIDK